MSDLVRRLRNYWPDDGDFGPTKLCREAADRIERLERENEELRNACLSDAMQATPLTPHGEAIAAGDGTLHGAIDYWQQQAFTMAAGQCIITNGGLMADDHGHQYCDMQRQRDEWKRKAEENARDAARLDAIADYRVIVEPIGEPNRPLFTVQSSLTALRECIDEIAAEGEA